MLEFLTLKSETFGLDISDLSLKIAKLKKRRNSLSLVSFGEMEIKPGIIERGEIKKEDELVKIIKEALLKLRGEKIKTRYIVASLPEEKAFLQIIQMPLMKEEELKKAVYFEAENYIPLPLNEVYLDFQVIKPVVNHLDHFDVLIVAMPKKIVDSYISCFKKANLIPLVLEIESQAAARALIKNEVSPSPILLIDFGLPRASFIIFSGYTLRFTSSIPVSSKEFTQAIADNLKITFSEAEEMKIKYGIEGKGGEKITEILNPYLKELIKEIEDYLSYYHTHIHHEHLPLDSKEVEKILLCGGGANLKGLTNFLSLKLKIPVELGNPWINILPQPLREIPELPFEKSLSFTNVLGLALRDIKHTNI